MTYIVSDRELNSTHYYYNVRTPMLIKVLEEQHGIFLCANL